MSTLLQSIEKRFANVEWYKQGGAVKPLTGSYPTHVCLGFTVHGKRVAMNYTPYAWYLKDDYFDVYFPRDGMRRVARWYFNKELQRPGFVADLKQQWEEKLQLFFVQIRTIEKIDFHPLSNKELLDLFHAFSKSQDALWREAIFLDAFDVSGEEILESERTRAGVVLTGEALTTLTAPIQRSSLQRERKDLFKLARGTRNPNMTVLKHHANQYHWIYNDYAVIKRLDWKFFRREINELRLHPEQWRQEARTIAAVARSAGKKQRLARLMKLPSRFVHTCTLLTTLAAWRDLRKSMNQQGNAVVQLFAEEFARRTRLTVNEVEYLWWWEMRDIFTRTRSLQRHAHARMNGVLILGNKKKNLFYYGKEGESVQRYLENRFSVRDTIEGRSAYPGVVRGIAKIILTQRDFKKMKHGDILVAPNTRPEYVPIMKIAGAIISEEGGLTCHSAIVARELKIPAVVGAQGAIAALKDGDHVEVDAVNGIVRKI